MDEPGQHDPHGVLAAARQVVAQHRQSSVNGCCMKCGRAWDPDSGCDAPEVMNARQVLNGGRPSYRLPGTNRLAAAYGG